MTPIASQYQAFRWPRAILTGAAGAVAILATLGTLTGATGLATLGSGLVPMSPIIAGLLLMLVGALLLREARPESRQLRRLAILLAMTVAWLCLGLLAGHAAGDPWLERVLTLGRPQVQFTSLLTVIALLGAALSALVHWWPLAPTWRNRQGAAVLALCTLAISSVVLISYLAGAPVLYGSDRIPMALPSALSSWMLGCSLWLAADFDTWPLAALARTIEKRRGLAAGFSLRVTISFLVAVVLVIAGGSLFLRVQIRRARTSVQTELVTIADFKVRQIASWWGERRDDAEGILHARLIQGQLQKYLTGPASATFAGDVRAWMEELQKSHYHRVALFDGQGRLRFSAQSSGTDPVEPMDPLEIQAALLSREVLVRDLRQHPGRDDIYLSLWVPIGARAGGRADGALLLILDPRAFLFPLLQSWPTASPSAETMLVRREGGQILFLNELRHRSGTAMRLRLPVASDPKAPSIRTTVGQGGLTEGLDYRGVRVLAVLRRIPDTNWSVVAKLDAAEVYGPLRRMAWTMGIVLLGLVGLLGAGLVLFLWHHDKDMLRHQLHLSERFLTLMNEANDIILVLDGEGRIREANARAVELYGYALEELQGMDVVELRAPDCREGVAGVLALLKVMGSSRFETVHCRKDGGTFPVEVSTRALKLDGELRVISFVRDITERRAQERELQRMTRLYAALSQVNQAIVKSTTRQELLDKVCEVLVEFGSFSVAWIGWNDPQSHLVTVIARYGDTTGYLDRIRVESGDSSLAQGPTGTAIREGCPCVVNDFQATPGTEAWRAAAAEAGFQASASFPIHLGGAVVGALTVHANETDFFGAHEAELLVEAAGDISFGMDHLAGETRRSESEAALVETERFLTEAQEAGEIGTFTWLIPGDHWQSSPYLDRIFGIGPE
ncbi:MAG TPA: GAF domain-containing protein, partial [Geothrix sp.]